MLSEFKALENTIDFFEGFKSLQNYILFGQTNWTFNMDNVQTNLLFINKNNIEKVKDIASYYERMVEENDLDFALITYSESENYLMCMTFTNKSFMSLHEIVNLNDVIQLLDDATSTNDCLRAIEYLEELKEIELSEFQYKELKEMLLTHINEKGWTYIKNYNAEILPQSRKKGLK